MIRYLVAAALLLSAVPAMAQPPAPPPGAPSEPACLRQINMYDFKPIPGNRSLLVIDRGGKRYRVNFVGQCYDLQYPMGLRFKTRGTSNLSCVSRGDQVLFHDPAGPGFCMIRDVQYQTPALDQQDAAAATARKQQ
ncbi:MAG TPA: DUF6491 family protein [Rhizomicrobium sp.]|nr:DUF6491 family protein [Rhizomicrobium sp.]